MEDSDGDAAGITQLLEENEAFSELGDNHSSSSQPTPVPLSESSNQLATPQLMDMMAAAIRTAVAEAIMQVNAVQATNVAGRQPTRRLTYASSNGDAKIVYMRSDQKEFPHKMTSVREGNITDMIKLVQTQQLLSEYASDNHLDAYNWNVAFTSQAKESIVSFINTNNHVRRKLPGRVQDVLNANGPSTEIVDLLDSDDLHAIVSYMLRPTTVTSALQALKAVPVYGTWQNVGMVVQLKARLQAFLQYVTLFEKVYRLVCSSRCKIGRNPLVEIASFIKISTMKKGAPNKEETIEAIMKHAVVQVHQLLSNDLFDYIVSPFKNGDKLMSLLSLSVHRAAQLANSHERHYVHGEATSVTAFDDAPDISAFCVDQVKANADGHRDVRSSLMFVLQFHAALLREHSTLVSELFVTASQRTDNRKAIGNKPSSVFLQMVDLVGESLNGDIPEAEVAAILQEAHAVDHPAVDLSAIDKAHIPTGQGYFLKKQQQQQRPRRIQKRGCYLKADAGVCTRDNCNFDHSEEVIREAKKSPHFQEWRQRAGHQSRQLSQATLASVADYQARAELASQSAPPSSPVELIAEEEAGED